MQPLRPSCEDRQCLEFYTPSNVHMHTQVLKVCQTDELYQGCEIHTGQQPIESTFHPLLISHLPPLLRKPDVEKFIPAQPVSDDWGY